MAGLMLLVLLLLLLPTASPSSIMVPDPLQRQAPTRLLR